MAGRQHLTVAIKVEEDSGIDFICQAEQASGAKSANPMIPAHFGVGVRATNTVTGRVKLNRADATNKLLSRSPVLRDGLSTLEHQTFRFQERCRLVKHLPGKALTAQLTRIDAADRLFPRF